MIFTAIFVTIFLIAFALIAGVVMFLSRTIEHGEARFDANGKMITEREPASSTPASPAGRIEQSDTTDNES
jgi:hypothetical protein